jgi:magnesium chelatase family protein
MNKISGPLLDRIDIHIEVDKVDFEQLSDKKKGETSSEIRQRVIQARKIQSDRFNTLNINCNAQMGPKK